MNITGLLLPLALAPAIIKFMKRTESESNGSVTTPPTSKTGVRTTCKIGEKLIYNDHLDKYICVPDFK